MTLITEKDDSSVRVALRVRPQSAAEKIDMCRVCTSVMDDSPQIVLGKDKAFTYDYVFDTTSHQEEIFKNVSRELIDGCFDGYNATILAYGQTGSGKTYTMGTSFDMNNSLGPEQVGIIPRAMKHLFDGIQRLKKEAVEKNVAPPEFKVQCQFIELYNEEIVDLLDIENKGRKVVKIHEDVNSNIYTTGVVMRNVTSEKDIMKVLEEGALSRTTASTNMNATSSRSHAIFTVHLKHHRMAQVEAADGEGDENGQTEEFETLSAKFNFVDLAGSERLKRTGATGDRAKEGISINQGLLSLGNVISALGDRLKRGCHVPYRDSKLTRLLQDSLGGNSRTIMIACVSPSDRDFMETLNTLKYANRARNIKNKVVVNQDKASKQIAALRAEIQTLQIELMEYKQGKRVADGDGGDHMSDVFHENTMLNTENENLRLRMKALQETIDSQTQQIAELKASAVLGKLGDGENDVEALIVGYVKEIEELSNKLIQSEAMSSAAVKRARAISRMAMSPGGPEEDAAVSLIELAKLELQKEKKKMRKGKHHHAHDHKHHTPSPIKEADESEVQEKKDENENEKGVDDEIETEEANNENENQDENEENPEDEDEEEEEDNDDGSFDSDDDDDAISLAESSYQEEVLREDIADVSTEITIKQKLIEELEHSQQRLSALKHQYEEKLHVLQNKIKETEDERDKVLRNLGSVDSKAQEKSNEIRIRYEKKLNSMQKEMSKLQSAKREHARLMKAKEQNEAQLKMLKNELSDLKKIKVKLMRQMRDEVSKAKHREEKFSSQLEQMIKENRKRDIQIKNLKQDKKQKDLILKRKQEELNSIRKQIKPVSGTVGMKKKLEEENAKLRAQVAMQNSAANDEPRKRGQAAVKTPTKERNPGKPTTPQKSPAVSRNAKKKWEMLERKMNDLMLKMKTVASMENDMERWLQDRDRVSKQLEGCQKKREEASRMNRDESLVQELNEQHEALTAQMEYIQENITESQSTIMEMEDVGELINSNEIIRGCSLSEARYMLDHFYGRTVELSQEVANKDAAYKELELRLEAMEQHCEVQQQLLQHVFVEKHFGEAGGDEEYQAGLLEDTLSENGLQTQPNFKSVSRKARRRTGCPEDFLRPTLANQSTGPNENPAKQLENALEKKVANMTRKGSDTPEVNQALMQKLMEIDKALKRDKSEIDTKLMPPPTMSRGIPSSSQSTGSESRSRSLQTSSIDIKPKASNNKLDKKGRANSFGSTGSLNDVGMVSNGPLPPSFQRGNRVSKSARTFDSKFSDSHHSRIQPSSAKGSPTQLRKQSSADIDKASRPGSGFPSPGSSGNLRGESSNNIYKSLPRVETDSTDVFKRLTSNLPQEADPDLGQMLPVKAPQGRPENLMCTHTATGHTNAVLSLAVTENMLITGSKDRTAKIWDLNRGDEILSLSGHKRDVAVVKYSPITKLVFTVNQSTIKIWDIRQRTGVCVKTLSGNFFQLGESAITCLELNSTGDVLYSAVGNSVKMVDLKTYGTLGKLSGHSGTVTCLLVTKGDRKGDICVTGSKDHYVKVFEVLDDISGSQMPRHNLEPPHYDGVESLVIKGETLFSGSRDNSIKKWNLHNYQLKHHITTAHKDWVCSLNLVPKYDVVASGCRSGVLKTWHSESCTQIGEINAHSKSINAISANSSLVFTASSDRLVRIWKPTPTMDEQVQAIISNDS
eukprot:gene12993-3761_t